MISHLSRTGLQRLRAFAPHIVALGAALALLAGAPGIAAAQSASRPADGPALAPGVTSEATAEASAQDSSVENEAIDRLFEGLRKAESKEQADIITATIWRMWRQSGSATTDLLMERSLSAMDDDEFETALQILDEVVELAPDFAEGWNRRATVHFRLRQYGASISDISHTLALEPRHFGAMSGLGAILKETGREAAALEIYRRALALNPHLEGASKAVKELTVKVEGRGI